jgi:hypothetical protein
VFQSFNFHENRGVFLAVFDILDLVVMHLEKLLSTGLFCMVSLIRPVLSIAEGVQAFCDLILPPCIGLGVPQKNRPDIRENEAAWAIHKYDFPSCLVSLIYAHNIAVDHFRLAFSIMK